MAELLKSGPPSGQGKCLDVTLGIMLKKDGLRSFYLKRIVFNPSPNQNKQTTTKTEVGRQQ